jgi:polyisoprenoid-binding protein YceI
VVLRVEQHGQARDPWGNLRSAFTAKTSIDRKDFGLTWNQVLETGGVMVGDRVDIEA